ncbi:haloacid dehalogenase type II [Labrys okinawensis]|uniref:haloacid dehalogenase type II n=1 Tax=Labrys okinawensis TaxID=346911 RepID=UPI0039BCA419
MKPRGHGSADLKMPDREPPLSKSATDVTRRTLLIGAAGLISLPTAAIAASTTSAQLGAVAFDAFTIFDARSITALVQGFWGASGTKLMAQWTGKLFGYTWLETAAGRYSGFEAIADAALRQTAEALALPLSTLQRETLTGQYRKLDVWPDVVPTLTRLRTAGLRLALLSNLSDDLLRTNMTRNGLDQILEQPLSTDRVQRFKPAGEAYALGEKAFDIPRSQIGFAAYAGWDAVGAQWFGYPTCWVNRAGQSPETLGDGISFVTNDMTCVVQLAGL